MLRLFNGRNAAEFHQKNTRTFFDLWLLFPLDRGCSCDAQTLRGWIGHRVDRQRTGLAQDSGQWHGWVGTCTDTKLAVSWRVSLATPKPGLVGTSNQANGWNSLLILGNGWICWSVAVTLTLAWRLNEPVSVRTEMNKSEKSFGYLSI